MAEEKVAQNMNGHHPMTVPGRRPSSFIKYRWGALAAAQLLKCPHPPRTDEYRAVMLVELLSWKLVDNPVPYLVYV